MQGFAAGWSISWGKQMKLLFGRLKKQQTLSWKPQPCILPKPNLKPRAILSVLITLAHMTLAVCISGALTSFMASVLGRADPQVQFHHESPLQFGNLESTDTHTHTHAHSSPNYIQTSIFSRSIDSTAVLTAQSSRSSPPQMLPSALCRSWGSTSRHDVFESSRLTAQEFRHHVFRLRFGVFRI